MSLWFGLGAHQAKLLPELQFPSIDIGLTIIEDDSVSGCPKHPASGYEYLSENRMSKISSSYNNHIKWWQVQVPIYRDSVPTFLAEWAFKEQMKTCLFLICVTQHAAIIIKCHIFSP